MKQQGYVLEASPLPKLPITHFEAVDSPAGEFHVTLAHQSREDEAVNGTDPRVPSLGATRRYPFVLMLDRIVCASQSRCTVAGRQQNDVLTHE